MKIAARNKNPVSKSAEKRCLIMVEDIIAAEVRGRSKDWSDEGEPLKRVWVEKV